MPASFTLHTLLRHFYLRFRFIARSAINGIARYLVKDTSVAHLWKLHALVLVLGQIIQNLNGFTTSRIVLKLVVYSSKVITKFCNNNTISPISRIRSNVDVGLKFILYSTTKDIIATFVQ